MDFPQFTGEDRVIDWLRQVEQFFSYNNTNIQEWIHVCSYHLKKEALQWFYRYSRNVPDYDQWSVFHKAFQV